MEYQITKQGQVINSKGRILKPWISKSGYLEINLNGKHHRIHRWVAQTYIPNPLNLPEVNHIDGDKLNVNDWNLEWCTQIENTDHARRNNLTNIGTTYINMNQRNDILEKYNSGNYNQIQLAKEYNVHDKTIWNIIHHKTKRFEVLV